METQIKQEIEEPMEPLEQQIKREIEEPVEQSLAPSKPKQTDQIQTRQRARRTQAWSHRQLRSTKDKVLFDETNQK